MKRATRVQMLILDVDESVVEAIKECFPESQYRCVTATRPQPALEFMKLHQFQIVISSVQLHGMSGLEFLRRGRWRNPNASFLVTASPEESRLATEAQALGAVDCIYKPFTTAEIKLRVERALQQQETRMIEEIFEALSSTTLQKRSEHLHNVLQQSALPGSPQLELLVAGLDTRESTVNLHSMRVQSLCVLLGEKCGYPRTKLGDLGISALLHDIGKIAIPSSILLKPKELSQEEFAVMTQHARFGYQVLSRVPHLQYAAELAYSHHERMDGSGYPRRLKGEEIPLEARIFAVADTADVILAGRPYAPPRTFAQAQEEIRRCSGSQFDADIVDVFMRSSVEEWIDVREQVNRRYDALRSLFPQAMPKLQNLAR